VATVEEAYTIRRAQHKLRWLLILFVCFNWGILKIFLRTCSSSSRRMSTSKAEDSDTLNVQDRDETDKCCIRN